MKLTPLFLCLLCVSSAAFGQCFDDDLRGSYGFIASTGATSANIQTASPFTSNTPIGGLVGTMSSVAGGNATGAFYFDGFGRIYGTNTIALPQGVTSDVVGNYSVSSDCTVRVTVFDIFNDTVNPTSPNNPSLVGVVLRSGDEVSLSRVATTGIGLSPRTAIRLVRFNDRYTAGCTVSSLRGTYGLSGEGINQGTYAAVVARLNFDGDGKVVPTTVSGTSALAVLQFRGTYIVNRDCTGTMTVTQTTDAANITGRFLITPESGFVDASGRLSSQPAQDLKPGLLFSIFDTDRLIDGVGTAQ